MSIAHSGIVSSMSTMPHASLEEILDTVFGGDVTAFEQKTGQLIKSRRLAKKAPRKPKMPDTPVILDLLNVCKEYKLGRKNTVQALKNVNLEIHQGEIVAITGPSGSGKSTLLQLIGGIDTPTSGDIIIDGKKVNKMSQRKLAKHRLNTIGFVFQFFYLQPFLTVSRNVEVPLMFAKLKRSRRAELIQKVLQDVDTADRAGHKPSELSGGQMQRIAIARALINKPKIILADEPTGNLDSENGRNIIDLLQRVRDTYKTTVIIVTHDPVVASAADRIIRVSDGVVTS